MKRLWINFVIYLLSLSASYGGIWYGGAGDNQWSNANNWVLGDVADGTGENAVFDTRGAGSTVLSQARSVRHMYQSSSGDGANHTFSGSSVSVYGNLSNNSLNDSTMTFTSEVVMTGGIYTIGTKQGGKMVLGGTLTLSNHTIFASANSGLEISGNVAAAGNDLRVNKVAGSWDVTPASVLSLTGLGTWSGGGALKVYEGIFLSNRTTTDSSAVLASSVQLFDGGTFLLGNDEQIGNGVFVSVGEEGGLFDLDGHTETIKGLGALSSGLMGAVAMGPGGILHLADQSSVNLGGLTITEWTDGEDYIYVDGGGFTTPQLENITFSGFPPGATVEEGQLRPGSGGGIPVPNVDGDGDKMLDSWEMQYFGTTDRNGTGDFDGDGESDLIECFNYTDPADVSSAAKSNTFCAAEFRLMRCDDAEPAFFFAELKWCMEPVLTNGVVTLPGATEWAVPQISNGVAQSTHYASFGALVSAGFSNGVYAACFALEDGRTIRQKYVLPEFSEADFPASVSLLSPVSGAVGVPVFAPFEFLEDTSFDTFLFNGEAASTESEGGTRSVSCPVPRESQSDYLFEFRLVNPDMHYLGNLQSIPFSTGGSDTDSDGIPDNWEWIFFRGDCLPDGDANGDGLGNLAAYLADLDPVDPESVLRVVALECSEAGETVSWKNGGTNSLVELLYCSSLTNGSWTAIHSISHPQSPENSFLHDTGTNTAGFYRMRASRQD